MPRFDTRRWRWRLAGAWQWPVFIALTVAEAVLLTRLPVWGDGPEGGLIAAGLLAACLNLILVAVLAPAFGMLVRLRRPDLPRQIASNYAGTVLLVLLFAGLLAGGLSRTDDRDAEARDRAQTVAAVDDWVRRERPALAPSLRLLDTMQVDQGLWRSCVPGIHGELPTCVFVETTSGRASVMPDGDRIPNDAYRARGGF